MKKLLSVGIILLLLAQAALAQDEDKPSVAMLSFQPFGTIQWVEAGFLKTLVSYGLLSPAALQPDADGAPNDSAIAYQRQDAGGQLDLVSEVVADAINSEPDALVTIGSRLTLAALLETKDMDNPPAIVFADVYNPYEAGLADAPCIKLDHVTGIVSEVNYAEIVPMLQLQDPDMQTIGTIFSSDDAAGAYGAAQIAEVGASLGLNVEQAAVTSLADVAFAADGLVSKGADAIMLPVDTMTLAGLPIISAIAQDNGIPLYAANIDHLFFGALAGGGFASFLDVGDLAGLQVAALLTGELDLATTSISAIQSGTILGINQRVADAAGIVLTEEMRERADFTLLPYGDILRTEAAPRMQEELMRFAAPPVPLEERAEMDQAFLAGLQCTPEMIAEQQAELDAMEG